MAEARGFKTFEVTLPTGDNHDQELALYGLATAFGWGLNERYTLSSDLERQGPVGINRIDPDQMLNLSHRLWGTDIYGRTAIDFIEEERRYVAS